MKALFCLSLLALSLSAAAGPGHDHSKDHKPSHGGVMVVGPVHLDWELVAQPGRFVIHVRDEAKALATAGATGKLTLLAGGVKSEAVLKPAAPNLLVAEGAALKPVKGMQVVATLQLQGKSAANVRFVLP